MIPSFEQDYQILMQALISWFRETKCIQNSVGMGRCVAQENTLKESEEEMKGDF